MKRALLFFFAIMTVSVISPAQISLFNHQRVCDTYRKGETSWQLVIEITETDRIYNNQHQEEDSRNTLRLVDNRRKVSYKIPNYLVENNTTGGMLSSEFIDARFSISKDGDFPKYIFYVLPTYTTDNEIYSYNIVTEKISVVHSGTIQNVLPSGNLLITVTGFAKDTNGEILPGRMTFDMIISPTGKELWKSEPYDM